MAGAARDRLIHIRVKLLGHLRQSAGQPIFDLQVQAGSTIAEILDELTSALGREFQQSIIDTSGKLHGGIEIILNQEHLPARKTDSIKIDENCELILMPMIEGGSVRNTI